MSNSGKKVAPHVQAAIARGAQAKVADPGGAKVAPHVQAAIGGGAQAKVAESGGAKVAPHVQAAIAGGAQAKLAEPGGWKARSIGSEAAPELPQSFHDKSMAKAFVPSPRCPLPLTQSLFHDQSDDSDISGVAIPDVLEERRLPSKNIHSSKKTLQLMLSRTFAKKSRQLTRLFGSTSTSDQIRLKTAQLFDAQAYYSSFCKTSVFLHITRNPGTATLIERDGSIKPTPGRFGLGDGYARAGSVKNPSDALDIIDKGQDCVIFITDDKPIQDFEGGLTGIQWENLELKKAIIVDELKKEVRYFNL